MNEALEMRSRHKLLNQLLQDHAVRETCGVPVGAGKENAVLLRMGRLKGDCK